MLIALLTALAAPAAQNPPPFAAPPQRAVLHAATPDGTQWALGSTYKAAFASNGVGLLPRLGPRATTSPWLRFGAPILELAGTPVALDAAAPALRDGDRIRYERGALVERWDLGASALEHSFELAAPLGPGAASIRIPLDGPYTHRDVDDGLAFDAPQFGGLRYGDVLLRDADGRELATASRLEAGAIVLDLPEAFLASAHYPLLVDPIVNAFGVDTSSALDDDPELAYNAANDVWLVVYTETVTGADRDIVSRRYRGNGTFLDEVGVELSSDDTVTPDVANNVANGRFMIVWARTGGVSRIQGRTRESGSTAQGSEEDLSGITINGTEPRIGGSTSTAYFSYLLAWKSSSSLPGLGGVRTAVISLIGTASNEELVYHPSFGDIESVEINEASDHGGRWMVVFTESETFSSDQRLLGALVDVSGNQVGGEFTLQDFVTPPPLFPSVAGDGTTFFTVWERDIGGSDSDIFGRRAEFTGAGVTLGALTNLSQREGATPGVDQIDPAIAGDGTRIAYAYRERGAGGANFDVFVSSVSDAAGPDYAEIHVPVAVHPVDDRQPALASKYGGGGADGAYAGAWTRANSGNPNVHGYLYGDAGAGGVSVVQTGCGGFFEPLLFLTGAPIVGAHVQVLLVGSGTPLLVLGHVAALPLPLCPTSGGCQLGAFPLIQTFGTNSKTFQIPNDATLSGQTAALQGVRLNPLTAGPACGAPDYPFPFRTSDTLVLTFQ